MGLHAIMNIKRYSVILFFFIAVIHAGASESTSRSELFAEHINITEDEITVLHDESIRPEDTPVIAMNVGTACENASTSFTGQLVSGGPILQWSWNFGDGNTAVGMQVFHEFETPGTYLITLTAACMDECSVSIEQTIVVHPAPVVSFETGLLCSLIPVVFTDNSTTAEGDIIQSSWVIGGNFYSGQSVEHLFASGGPGSVIHTVVNSLGCYAEWSGSVDVKSPPVVSWTSEAVCLGSLTSFVANVEDNEFTVSDYNWQLGDGTTSQLQDPNHYYATSGAFNVTLVATNSFGCSGSFTSELNILNRPRADFLIANACQGMAFELTDQSQSQSIDPVVDWTWTLPGNQVYHEQNPSVVFDSLGLTPVQLTIVTQQGCSGTLTQQIPVWPVPVADFSYDPMIGEAPIDFHFHNSSQGAVESKWLFGDTFLSEENSPVHTFTLNGTFYTQLLVTNQYGCSDSTGKIIRITAPVLDIRVRELSFVKVSEGTRITCELVNTGTIPVDEIQLSLQAGSQTISHENLSAVLYPDSVIEYTFTALVSVPDDDEHYLCVNVKPVNSTYQEVNFTDNTICKPLKSGSLEVFPPYPNPGDDRMFIRFVTPEAGDLNLRVYDPSGKLVMDMNDVDVPRGFHQYFMDISSLENGHYVLLLQLGSQETNVAFMKMRK